MTYDMYHTIFITAGLLCGVMLAVTILLFFVLKVPKLISYFTGVTERKAVKNIRQRNERSGSRLSGSNIAASGSRKAAGKICLSGHLSRETEPLSTSGQASDETSVLSHQEKRFQVEYEIFYIHSNEIIG